MVDGGKTTIALSIGLAWFVVSCTGSDSTVTQPTSSSGETTVISNHVETTTTNDPFPGTFPASFDLEQIMADVESGKEKWLDQSLFAGVSVEAAEQWAEQNGFTQVIVSDPDDSIDLIGGPGRTLLLIVVDGVVQTAHSISGGPPG